MFRAKYIGEIGLYQNKEYIIRIGTLNGRVVINRKCGAGRVYYNSIVEFLQNWDNIRKA